jgi:ABC-type cobalamin transport system permease subunit
MSALMIASNNWKQLALIPLMMWLMLRSKAAHAHALGSRHWKQFAAIILLLIAVGTFITKAPAAELKAHAALSAAEHVLHDADADGRQVRPIPLLG